MQNRWPSVHHCIPFSLYVFWGLSLCNHKSRCCFALFKTQSKCNPLIGLNCWFKHSAPQSENVSSRRKQEFQSCRVETTFDLRALPSDLRQVETLSLQPVGPSAGGSSASTLASSDKYYHFAEARSDKHGVGYMWGLIAHVIAGVNAVSGLWAEVIGCGKQTKTPVLHVQLLGRAAAGIRSAESSTERRRGEPGRPPVKSVHRPTCSFLSTIKKK